MSPKVYALSKSEEYSFSKKNYDHLELIENYGVKGDIHAGKTVKHRSRVRKDPSQPNLRQVHLIHKELFDELNSKGYDVQPGNIGENICTVGIDLLNLPEGTILKIGNDAEIKITGLRNPCHQLNDFQAGLMNELVSKDSAGNIIRRSGIMSVVIKSGIIKTHDPIEIKWPAQPHKKLEKV